MRGSWLRSKRLQTLGVDGRQCLSENSCGVTPSFNFQSSEPSMSRNEFRRMAAKMDQHMRQLSAQGVNDRQVILDRMMGYVPELHAIWTGTSDDQLVALFHEFPEFYRYARLMGL
jgi:hypothetical protein